MNKFNAGDKVNIHDSSYIFGIKKGEYSGYCNCRDDNRNNLTVVATDLSVVKLREYPGAKQNNLSGRFTAVNDLLVTDGNGSFWFTQSRFCKPVDTGHNIVIDGKTVRISHESFLSLKGLLV